MKTPDQLITEAYSMGFKSKGIDRSAPYDNKEFMEIVPDCATSDSEGIKLRQRMCKAFTDGWTSGNLSNGVEDMIEDVTALATLNAGKKYAR